MNDIKERERAGELATGQGQGVDRFCSALVPGYKRDYGNRLYLLLVIQLVITSNTIIKNGNTLIELIKDFLLQYQQYHAIPCTTLSTRGQGRGVLLAPPAEEGLSRAAAARAHGRDGAPQLRPCRET